MRLPTSEDTPLNSAIAMFSASPFATGAISLLGSVAAYGLYKILAFIYAEFTSPLRNFPGPPSPSFVFGNFKQMRESMDTPALQEKWIREYGNNINYSSMFGISSLFTADLKALNYVLTNSYDFQKPEAATYNIRRILGNGIIVVEGDVHKNQRRILNPAFAPQQVRELTEVFVEKAVQMRDLWSAEIVKQKGTARLDGTSWIIRTTLDIIGVAGFDHQFDSLTDSKMNPFETMLSIGTSRDPLSILKAMFPVFRILPAKNNPEYVTATANVKVIVDKLINQSKAAVAAHKHDAKTWNRKDLLSLLIRANAMPDLPENKRLSDADVAAQIFTFLLAGHETTAVSITWALYALTQNKEVQRKLREEIYTIGTDNPTLDDLNSLPYLDRVIREALRVHPSPPFSMRVASRDNVIPLSEPFTDTKGVVHNEIRIKKGQTVTVPIAVINRSKALWGEDAMEFKPERWEKLPEAVHAVPGIYGNVLTFMGGPRSCIGYRFALAEMKAIVFTLVRAFELDLAVPGKDIGKTPVLVNIMQRPMVLTEPSKESAVQLPLVIRPVSFDS